MKAAVRLLVGYIVTFNTLMGLEGWFLAFGTLLLAVASSYISPAGPWAVVGFIALVLGLALALPTKRAG